MSEKITITNLSELGGAIKERDHANFKEEFERILKGRLSEVVRGRFNVSAGLKEKGVNNVVIGPFKLKLPDHEEDAVFITTAFQDNPNTFSFQMREDGSLNGEARDNRHNLTREEVASDVVDIIDRIGLGLWTKIDDDILAGTDPLEVEDAENNSRETNPRSSERSIDPIRLEFLEGQEKILFGAVNKETGFDGYHIAIFPKGFILENPIKTNAAFVVELQQPLVDPQDPEIFSRPAERRMDKESRDDIINNYIKKLVIQAETKKGLLALGAKRIVHQPDTEKWQRQMQEIINQQLI